jgi:hypothetical protein
MLGFKSLWSAAFTLAGIELMHMIRKGQLLLAAELCPAQQFYSLAQETDPAIQPPLAHPEKLRQNPNSKHQRRGHSVSDEFHRGSVPDRRLTGRHWFGPFEIRN